MTPEEIHGRLMAWANAKLRPDLIDVDATTDQEAADLWLELDLLIGNGQPLPEDWR